MLALGAALGLLLVGMLRAFPQDRPLEPPCAGASNRYYDKASGSCCYRCPPGQSPVKTQPCPQGPADCRKQCDQDYYLSASDRCTACVSCVGDLVEKAPCSQDAPRVCQCRPGMFCKTSAANSCARCSPHSVCKAGLVVKSPGTAEKDTECGPPSPGTGPDCTSPEDCETLTSGTTPQAKPILISPATADPRTTLQRGVTSRTLEDAALLAQPPQPPSSASKRSPVPDPELSPSQLCPPGSADCRKQCDPDYYLDATGRCMACVSCSLDLVEKAPCSWSSPRVCACRPGMICATSATNSCARCIARPACPPGMVVTPQGVAEREATNEPPPPGTHPDCSTPGSSEAPASAWRSVGRVLGTQALSAPPPPFPTPPSPLPDSLQHGPRPEPLVGSHTGRTLPSSTASLPSTRKPILDPGPVLFWVIMVPVLVVGSSFFFLCHKRACRRRFRQKLHLCDPAQTFRPKLELVDSRPRRNLLQPRKGVLGTEPDTEEQSLVSPPAVETCASVGTACPGSLPLLGSSPAGGPSPPREAPEPPVSTEHTNNKIEKIYIMKADTVIVGTVKTEVSEGRGPAGPVGPEEEEQLEVDHVPHYPEQETEPPLGSCGDLMFSVEEEGKEDFGPTVASGK